MHVDLVDHGLDVDPLDDRLHVDPVDDGLDVDLVDHRLDINPLDDLIDIEGADDARCDLVDDGLHDLGRAVEQRADHALASPPTTTALASIHEEVNPTGRRRRWRPR